jgi:hypothetical protein
MDDRKIERQTVMIRGVDADAWALLRTVAVRRRWTTAAAFEHIVREWAADRAQTAASERQHHGNSGASRGEVAPDTGSDDDRADTVVVASVSAA